MTIETTDVELRGHRSFLFCFFSTVWILNYLEVTRSIFLWIRSVLDLKYLVSLLMIFTGREVI